MNFISNLFLAIGAFLGFGGTPEITEVETKPIAEEVIQKEETEATPAQEEVIQSNDQMTDKTDKKTEVMAEQEAPESENLLTTEEMTGTGGNQMQAPNVPNIQTMLVAGGCFWCVESDLEKTSGVIEAVSGYAGGKAENPTYNNYYKGGHREVVEVTYDANEISFEEILFVTLKTTDPTDDDGTFADRGDQYSSAFYYESPEQKQIIENLIKEVDEFGPYSKPLAIDIEERATFWIAEDFHQDYYKGTLSALKYGYYRTASGRDAFIKKHWGEEGRNTELPWRTEGQSSSLTPNTQSYAWSNYQKPSKDELSKILDPLVYKVTQEDGTERAGTSPLDKIYEPGIYVDVLSGEPLYSSKDKFDSGTGWPSFVKPISLEAVTEHEDKKLFTTRTEIRSAIADNHIGHVFSDGPRDRGGLRYCMNGAALTFVPKSEMEAEGYSNFLPLVE